MRGLRPSSQVGNQELTQVHGFCGQAVVPDLHRLSVHVERDGARCVVEALLVEALGRVEGESHGLGVVWAPPA